jgi:hypothetical protein
MNVDVSPAAGLTSVTVLAACQRPFTGPTGYMRPSSQSLWMSMAAQTGDSRPRTPFQSLWRVGDKFNGLTTRADGSAVMPIVIVDTNGGNAIARIRSSSDLPVLRISTCWMAAY